MIFLGLRRQKTYSVSLGLDDGSMNTIKTMTDEIIGEHVTPSMPWPEGLDGLIEDKEDVR